LEENAGRPPLVEFYITGLTEGLRIGFKEHSEPLKSAKRSLSCALEHPETVQNYIFDGGNCL